ncbi:ROK family protein [Mesorhizobium sp. M1423]|uniref:ROK family protein n=1 Tax=Mesorhizobium sp. M1423 TaxID=2957101 RepID=UPI00333B0549
MMTTQIPLLKMLVRRLIADALAASPMTISELGTHINMPEQNIVAAITELQGEGWIAVDERSLSDRKFRLAADAVYVLGVDVGGTKIAAALADATGQIVAELSEPTDPRGSTHVFDQICRLAQQMTHSATCRRGRIRSVVAGFPGAIDPQTHRITLVPNIRGLDGLDVQEELSNRFSGAIAHENDVNLAALGELATGCAQGCTNVAFVALGTGTGLGLVVDGRLVRGASGGAGEIAYLPIGADITSPEALHVGAFEHDAGSVAMLKRYRAKGDASVSSVREIFDRLNGGDPAAGEVLNATACSVALAITTLQAVLDLDLFVLGGSIGARPELIERVRLQIGNVLARPVRIVGSALGTRAGLIGAVSTATENLRCHAFGPPVQQMLASTKNNIVGDWYETQHRSAPQPIFALK